MQDIKQNVTKLNQMVAEGQIMDAMHTFYADDVVMGENDAEPTLGLKANLVREQAFVDNTTWYAANLEDVSLSDDTSMSRWTLDFHNTQYGNRLRFTQVAVAKWRDGKIIDERFYYSPTVVEA